MKKTRPSQPGLFVRSEEVGPSQSIRDSSPRRGESQERGESQAPYRPSGTSPRRGKR